MLSNLINLLSKNETYLNSMIADKLGVGEGTVKQMLHELERFGYVEKIDFSCCSSQCINCTSHCSSANFAGDRSAVWMLTEKGRKSGRKNITPWLQKYINQKYESIEQKVNVLKKDKLTIQCDEINIQNAFSRYIVYRKNFEPITVNG